MTVPELVEIQRAYLVQKVNFNDEE